MYPNSKLIKDIVTTREELNNLYCLQGLSTRQIANRLGTSQPTARKILRLNGICLRPASKKGIPPLNKGKRLSSEWRKKIGDAQRGQIRGQRTERITRICQFCLNGFEKLESHINSNNQAKFCSSKCFYDHRRANPKPKKPRSKIRKKIPTNCKQCNKEIFRRKEEIKKAKHGCFCTQKCSGEWKTINLTGDKIYNFKGGYDKWENYGPTWPNAKRLTRERDGNTCPCCLRGKKELHKNLDVHHFIPFRFFQVENHILANDLSNLISLCNKCHKKVEVITDKTLEDLGIITLEAARNLINSDFKKNIINQIKSTIFFPDYQI